VTAPVGLSQSEAGRRLARDGHNELPAPGAGRWLLNRLEVLREPMFALLIAAGILYALIGEPLDAAVLVIFATLSVSIAVIQRERSHRMLAKLRDLSAPQALVVRDGTRRRIAGREVVVGDLLVVNEGDRMAADALLVAGEDVKADEALLTGESVPVRKRPDGSADSALAAAGGEDLPNLYSGSLLVSGTGMAVVTATGAHTQLGRINTALQEIVPARAGLEAETRRWVVIFAMAGLGMSALAVVIHGLMSGRWLEALLAGIALSMAMLPEELPLVLVVFTVMGAWRLSRLRVLTRRPATIETLGAATVLCTDKTGTLTFNRMAVAWLESSGQHWQAEDPASSLADPAMHGLLRWAELATRPGSIDPMDAAVSRLANRAGAASSGAAQLIRTYPLRPDRPCIVQVWRSGDGALVLAAKGAPETLAGLCGLGKEVRARELAQVEALARKGMRMLGVASGHWPAGAALPEQVEALPLRWEGILGLVDPLRPSVHAAVADCLAAGVRVVMITGDHPATAVAIAAQAGIPGRRVLTGAELDALDDATLAREIAAVDIFARIRPDQKLRLVEALKADGQVVGMTGDGINDAPALKAAHIGIAMGGRGTDVAREAAALVLLDDDFAAIAQAIRQGRRIYDNIGKAVAYIFAIHIPIVGMALLPILLGMPLLLTPMLIAMMELLIDPTCSVIFEAEPAERDAMRRPPRKPTASMITAKFLRNSLLQGGLAFIAVAAVYLWCLAQPLGDGLTRSTTLLALLGANLCLVLANRSLGFSLVPAGGRDNPALGWGLIIAGSFVALVFTWPPARSLLRLDPPGAPQLVLCAMACALLWFALQVSKKVAPAR
jgi:P-type Ca2+ transporter type 2C